MHNHSAPAASTLKLPFYRQLYFQVVLAIVLGGLPPTGAGARCNAKGRVDGRRIGQNGIAAQPEIGRAHV